MIGMDIKARDLSYFSFFSNLPISDKTVRVGFSFFRNLTLPDQTVRIGFVLFSSQIKQLE